MHQASVGVHCPECTASNTQKVYTAATLPGAQGLVTRALVGINAAVFVLSIVALGATLSTSGRSGIDYGTWAPAIADGEWWRIVTGGFMHSGVIHIGFNMYLLWQIGLRLERMLGEIDFGLVYMTALFGGSVGAMLLDWSVPVVGASGAVFGLLGVMVMALRSQGIGLFDTGLGMLIGLNVLLSFRSGVSLGGHMGGLVIGVLLGVLWFGIGPGQPSPLPGGKQTARWVTLGLGVLLFGAAIAVAQQPIL